MACRELGGATPWFALAAPSSKYNLIK